MKEKIIARGAEAILIKKNKLLIKRRISKSYRYFEIDKKLRKQRTRLESRLLNRASVINVPYVRKVDEEKNEIIMNFISGKKLSDWLDKMSLKKVCKICVEIGKQVAKLHDIGIIHGDLTTSNMILSNGKIFFIDFGLGFHSSRAEDKAVDLHLLKQALESKHFKTWQVLFNKVLEGYNISKHRDIIERLKKVELRGRYKGKKN